MSRFRLILICALGTVVALGVFAVQAADEKAISEDIAALKRSYWPDRYRAADALGRLGPDAARAVPALREALLDKESYVRVKVAEALGKIGPGARDALPRLIEALKDPEALVREEVARAIGKLGPDGKDAVTPLRAVLKDDRREVRDEVETALKEIQAPPKVVPLPVPVLSKESAILQDALGPVRFSPDGKMIATNGPQGVMLWDTATWKKVAVFRNAVLPGAFSSDGRLLATFQRPRSDDPGCLTVWDLTTRKARVALQRKDKGFLVPLVFSEDGNSLAAMRIIVNEQFGYSKELKLWDLTTNELAAPASQPMKETAILMRLPHGLKLFWDVQILCQNPGVAPRGIAEKKVHANLTEIRGGAVTDDTKFEASVAYISGGFLGCPDDKIKLLNKDTKKEMILKAHVAPIYYLAFTSDGKRLASGDGDGNVYLWEVATGKLLARIGTGKTIPSNSCFRDYLAFTPDGKLLIVGAGSFFGPNGPNDGLKVWDVDKSRETETRK